MRLSSYLQDESLFAHGRPKEKCQLELTDARRNCFSFWRRGGGVMDVISEILEMIGEIAELIVTEILRKKKLRK